MSRMALGLRTNHSFGTVMSACLHQKGMAAWGRGARCSQAYVSRILLRSSSIPGGVLQPCYRTVPPVTTFSRAFGRSRRGRPSSPPPPRLTPPLPDTSQRKEGEEDEGEDGGIIFQEEDNDDMAAFMEEYDDVIGEEEEAKRRQEPVVELDLETVMEPDGTFTIRPRKKEQQQAEGGKRQQSAKEFLKSKRKGGGGAMTEDEWFEFLRRIGEPSPDDQEGWLGEGVKGGMHSPSTASAAKAPQRKGRYKFVDKIKVVAHGGRGGKGCISFEILKPGVKRPTGGHGGQGGDVIFVADPNVQTLDMDRHHFHGREGHNGDSANMRGARGAPILVRVPCGTVVKEIRNRGGGQGGYEAVEVCDLDEPMSFYKAAVGGKPGLGNSIQAGKSKSGSGYHFRAPGHQGEQRYYELELKTIADIGLVGYPNVGKSTLLGSLSRAKPKVADYAFTTLHPSVGKVEYSDAATVTVADLPGLIDGAHMNKGLGHEFLRHIERTKVLLFVLDGSVSSSSPDDNAQEADAFKEPPTVALTSLQRELELYRPGLSSRPSIVFINKTDLLGGQEDVDRVTKEVREVVGPDTPVLLGSAREGYDIDRLAVQLRLVIEAVQAEQYDDEEDLVGLGSPAAAQTRHVA